MFVPGITNMCEDEMEVFYTRTWSTLILKYRSAANAYVGAGDLFNKISLTAVLFSSTQYCTLRARVLYGTSLETHLLGVDHLSL